MGDDGCRTPQKQKIPPTLSEENLQAQDDSDDDDWESASFQLASTPVKGLSSPGSPAPIKIYEPNHLLFYKHNNVNLKIKQFFPQEPPPPPRVEIVVAKKPAVVKPKPAAQDFRPFQNLHVTSDHKPILPQDASQFVPVAAGARNIFGSNVPPQKTLNAQELRANQKKMAAMQQLPNRTENAFKVSQPRSDLDKILRAVNGILNRITPTTYATLFSEMWDRLVSCNLHDCRNENAMEVLRKVIGLIFEKALAEPSFSHMYADVARDLCDHAMATSPQQHDTSPQFQFRKILLDQCQTAYEAVRLLGQGVSQSLTKQYFL
eukprot:NODE_1233_length_1042_cov_56.423968_g944_i0.p1 GENE.NODE_1233_length_1042_cov_56.423968_g944_i0~~NODE_1233_length_1042_cov_56.423968_g944_i0.p1  ORF type:complete len:319 (-),score=28.45 NODE_1233_length_1042_cov_56.423968_g944_i0:28-984(-)